jgi:flagellar biosynthesis protein FlhB
VAEHDRDSRTEQPSERRLAHAREEGQLAVGHDVVLVAGLAAGALALAVVAGPMRDALATLFAESARTLPATPFRALSSLAAVPAALALAPCVAAALGAVAATLVQTGGGFWPHLAAPDLARVFRPQVLGRPFTKEFLVDLLAAAVKVVALGWAAWSVGRAAFVTLPTLAAAPPAEQLAATGDWLVRLAWRLGAVAALVAGADVAIQRRRFMGRMRMTKEELKRELKEEDGDPLLKGRRRQRHRELAKQRARVEVPRADALLVNPTHVAVALRYRKDEGKAPRVTAKGKGALAEHMRDLARSHGVPIVEDIPLARLLHRRVKVGREVPADTYKAVAAILAFVYRLQGNAGGAGRSA